ncbi:MAG: peroxidase family protein, partial [Bacteroidota bacterium]
MIALLLFAGASELLAQNNNRPGGTRRNTRVNGRRVSVKPRSVLDTLNCDANALYRSIDGTCNNVSRGNRMDFGSTDIELIRCLPAEYSTANPFAGLGGENRRSARDISNIVVDQPSIIFSAQNLSAIVYNWGQFLDHDLDLTPENEEEEEDIEIPDNEPLFTMDIPFFRSENYNLPNDGLPREQLNVLTAWVDGSNVYGSEDERADWLRTFVDGKLKTSAGDLLPFNTTDGEYTSPVDTTAPATAGADDEGKMWIAGDVRVGEQVGLTIMHTIFVREHNRICDELIVDGLTDDEEIYQE